MAFVAVLLAGAAGFAVGAFWYTMLGRRWMAAVGKSGDELAASRNPLPFLVAALGNLAVAGMMRHVFASSALEGVLPRLTAGLGAGLFLGAPWILTNYAFAGRPVTLWWIDAGHAVLACTAVGAVLGLMA